MKLIVLFAIGGGLFVVLVVAQRAVRGFRRKRLMEAPFPEAWEAIVLDNVALYRHLPDALKKQLHADMQIFLAEKNFEGAGGLDITDEIRVTIAAQACLLLLNREDRNYPGLDSIIVYPGAYRVSKKIALGDAAIEGQDVRLGESWRQGAVVLAWDHVKQDALYPAAGHSVVLHEFAHQLDQEDGKSDGVPILERLSAYAAWGRILGKEYQLLQESVRHNKQSLLNPYGATNPAEFFAVATETFFTKPGQMRQKEPKLYEELSQYYKVDPAAWLGKI